MVRVYEEMQVFEEMRLLSQFPEYSFELYRYVRTIQGHKEVHEVELALFEAMTMWPSYRQAWIESGHPEEECPGLGGPLVREKCQDEDGQIQVIEWGLVFTKPLSSRAEAFQFWRNRWNVENQGFRELNQGGWLESQTWGHSEPAILTSIALKIGAHNPVVRPQD